MKYLAIPFSSDTVVLTANGERSEYILSWMAGVLDLSVADAPKITAAVALDDKPQTDVFYEERGIALSISPDNFVTISIPPDAKLQSLFFLSCCGRLAMTILLALKPDNCISFHCALLEQNGKGIVLVAASGTGKSTTLARHCANGGSGLADDWALVSKTPSGFIAQVLPTWSKLSTGEATSYPINHTVPLAGLGLLARANGTQPRKEPLDFVSWYPHIFNASETLTGLVLLELPKKIAAKTRQCHIKMLDELTEYFPPFTYYASLDDTPGAILF